jgi:hypothetical protein
MFDHKKTYWATQLENRSNKNVPYEKSVTETRLYKIRCSNGIPYHIKIEEYGEELAFIKFYPAKERENKNKYKIRTGKQNDTSKIIAVCIRLVKDLFERKPDRLIGFFGQWDSVDVENGRTDSQRFSIYRKVVLSKFNKEDYGFVEFEVLNILMAYRKDSYPEEKRNNLDDIITKHLQSSVLTNILNSLINPNYFKDK